MGLKLNPLTAQFDLTGSGGGGAQYIDGEVATYNDLPLDGTAALNSAWLVRTASGVWPVSRKQAGIYIRTATAGSSRDADYTYAGTMPDVFSDAVLTIYDEAATTRTGQFNLGSITAGQNRVLTWPDGNGTIARTSDIPSTFAASAITSGVFDNARINFAAPSAIGSTTAAAITGTTGTFTTLSANNGTLTASAPVLDLAQTWNNAGVTFTGLQFVVTNTASNAASLVSRFAVGASNVVETNARGMTTFRRLGSSDLSNIVEFRLGSTLLANIRDDGAVSFSNNCTGAGCTMHNEQVRVGSGGAFAFTNTSNNAFGTTDVFLRRDAADTLAQRNGTTAQTFRLYNTYTDASNYERAKIAWSSNVLQIGTEAGGTGTARNLEFQTGGTTRARVQVEGLVLPNGALFMTNSSIDGQGDSNASIRLNPFSTGHVIISSGLLRMHGSSSSFPALKRSSTTLQVRLADDSADAPFSSGAITTSGTVTANNTTSGFVTSSALNGASPIRFAANSGDVLIQSANAAGIVEFRGTTGTNPQSLRVFNTFTSGTSFERLNIRWASNECIIDAEAGSGGGTLRGIKIGSATSSLLGFYGATPVTQRAAIVDATDAATTQARLNDLLAAMRSLGLIAT